MLQSNPVYPVSYLNILYKSILILTALLFRICLDSFYFIFCKQYAYFGLNYESRSGIELLLSYILILVPLVLLPLKRYNPSFVLYICLYFFQLVPISVLFALDADSYWTAFAGICAAYSILALFLHIKNPISTHWSFSMRKNQFGYVLLGIGLICCLLLISHYGFRLQLHAVDEMYQVRDEFKGNSSRVYVYLFNWFAYVINPVLFLWSFHNRKWFLLLASCIMQFYLFTVGAHKAVLLLLPFLMGMYYLIKYFKNILAISLGGGLLVLILLLLYRDDFTYPVSMQSSVVFWRGFIMPAQLYFDYFDFFQKNQLDWFAQSFPFDQFRSSVFDQKIPLIIGDKYMISGRMIHANANFWADLFVNTGLWSFLIGTLFLMCLFFAVDVLGSSKSMLIVIPFVSTSLIGLLNGPFIANIITNGMLLMLIVLALLPTEQSEGSADLT